MDEYRSLENAVKGVRGTGVRVTGKRAVSGGDINSSFILKLSDGSSIFMKSNHIEKMELFKAERDGLAAIAKTGTIKTPEFLAVGTEGEEAFLLLELIEEGQKTTGFFANFGKSLAELHKADTSEFVPGGTYGFTGDNYIGSGHQKNTPTDSWVEFFTEYRLKVQLERAASYFDDDDKKNIEKLMKKLPKLLTEPKKPSLLHGDLWGGNFLAGRNGKVWLIDPAVYVGSAEVDIAMTELFGGFSQAFYEEYKKSGLITRGYEKRRDIYNLYHLLNHLNLFGSGYLASVRRILSENA